MALSSYASDKRRGFTLVELTVVVAVMAILLTILCQIYLQMIQQWNREQGEAGALLATSRAASALQTDISQATGAQVITHFKAGDVLFFTLPSNTYTGIYVPVWSSNKLQYVAGSNTKAYYLSNSTGSYAASGNILWRGLVTWNAGNPVVTPDSTWDANSQRGQISPIDSLSFSLDNTMGPNCAYATVVSSYKLLNSTKQLSQTITVLLRNAN